ncbi:hypothetical protein OROMI_005726 [Orobanche minor]
MEETAKGTMKHGPPFDPQVAVANTIKLYQYLIARFRAVSRNFSQRALLRQACQSQIYRVKSTNPFKYSVEPKGGIVLSLSQINVIVTLVQSQKMPSFVYHDDKFLVQCVATPPEITVHAENHAEECKLDAVAIYNYGGRVKEISEDLDATSEVHTAVSSCTM